MKLNRSLRILCLAFLLFLNVTAYAQKNITVKGTFKEDSVKLGEETTFYLTARYPSTLNVLFPDTTFNFSPFELKTKRYFPTETRNGISYDSVVYFLTTFEVDKVQKLNLPVYEITPRDCTLHFANGDSIFFQALVKSLPDSITADLPLKATFAYQEVSYSFNIQVLLLVVVSIVVLAAIVWLLFGDTLREHWRIKRLQKAHRQFMSAYVMQLENLRNRYTTETTENAFTLWKKYMEQLSARPYTKLTTRETTLLEKNEMLGRNLRRVDSAIYGHDTDVVDSLENLRKFAQQRFDQKLQEVKNG